MYESKDPDGTVLWKKEYSFVSGRNERIIDQIEQDEQKINGRSISSQQEQDIRDAIDKDQKKIAIYIFGDETLTIDEVKQKAKETGRKATTQPLPLQETEQEELWVRNRLKDEYQKVFGRELVVVGEGDTEDQAIFHIDMHITFLPEPGQEKPTVVIADQSMTLAALEQLPPAALDQIEKQMIISELKPQYRHQCRQEDYRGLMDEYVLRNDIASGMQSYVAELKTSPRARALQKRLDATAEWFKQRGYAVERIPSAITYQKEEKAITLAQDGNINISRVEGSHGNHMTYNNAMVETYLDEQGVLQKHIYMPTFGISPIEEKAIQVFNTLGYQVHKVPSLLASSRAEGVLNCITSESRLAFDQRPAAQTKNALAMQ